MDEFDKSIKSANKTIEPSANFVDLTMDKVAKFPKTRSGWGFKAWGSALAGLVAVLAVVFIVVPMTGNNSTKTESLSNVSTAKGVSTNPANSGSSSTGSSNNGGNSTGSSNGSSSSTTMPAGTNNASLSSDLNSINSSINQENSDQSAANSAINDSSQEIAVPTN